MLLHPLNSRIRLHRRLHMFQSTLAGSWNCWKGIKESDLIWQYITSKWSDGSTNFNLSQCSDVQFACLPTLVPWARRGPWWVNQDRIIEMFPRAWSETLVTQNGRWVRSRGTTWTARKSTAPASPVVGREPSKIRKSHRKGKQATRKVLEKNQRGKIG